MRFSAKSTQEHKKSHHQPSSIIVDFLVKGMSCGGGVDGCAGSPSSGNNKTTIDRHHFAATPIVLASNNEKRSTTTNRKSNLYDALQASDHVKKQQIHRHVAGTTHDHQQQGRDDNDETATMYTTTEMWHPFNDDERDGPSEGIVDEDAFLNTNVLRLSPQNSILTDISPHEMVNVMAPANRRQEEQRSRSLLNASRNVRRTTTSVRDAAERNHICAEESFFEQAFY